MSESRGGRRVAAGLNRAGEQQHRRDGARQAVRDVGAHRPREERNRVDAAELPLDPRAQAPPERVADQQRAGEHGGPHRHPEQHREVPARVVREVANDELRWGEHDG